MDHMWKEGKSDPNKGAMRKWWKFFDDDYRKAQPIVIDDGGGNRTETTALYCATLGTWGLCPWEANRYDLGPDNCTGLIQTYGVEMVCGKSWKKIKNREKFDDRVKNGYFQ